MKTPLKSPLVDNKCTAVLKRIIPKNSVVHSFLFYDGAIEMDLCRSKRFVVAHTNKYVTYEFWQCLLSNPENVAAVAEHFYPIENKNVFFILQENWLKYADPFVRSGLFFLLNRGSDSSFVSSGELVDNPETAKVISNMKNFVCENFHLLFDKDESFIESIQKLDIRCDYVFLKAGSFSLNLFEDGKSLGFEQNNVIHKDIKHMLQTMDKKIIVHYKFSESVLEYYKQFNVHIIDKWGRKTDVTKFAQEVLVANF